MTNFDYHTAFSRNIGWVTPTEQHLLRTKRVAIAGLGGVGGSHVLTLARLGIGAFNIADFDIFELQNFNRQAGASIPHIGQNKIDVMEKLAQGINPEIDVRRFSEGINESNVDDFLEGVDLYLDSLDFFAVEARRMVFAACAEKGIPSVTAAPLGMGAALLNFIPGKMTFEEYFRLEGHDEQEQLIRFFLGLSPAMVQQSYLVDPTAINFTERRGPSTGLACEICAGVAGSQVLKILLNRGDVVAAPRGLHFDAFRNKVKSTWLPGGNNNPIQKLKLAMVRRKFSKTSKEPTVRAEAASQDDSIILQILGLARWAPSGDNNQPWRFEQLSDEHIVVHGQDTRDHVIYDLQGRASQLALGGLLETIDIAASAHGLACKVERRDSEDDTRPTFDIHFTPAPEQGQHPLHPFVRIRSTQRRSLSRRGLTRSDKTALESSLGDGYRVQWIEGAVRTQMAKLLFRNANIRLTTPEAFSVHRDIIDWDSQYSEERLPDQAVGLDPVALRMMRWALHSWERVDFLNKWLGGTLMPRIQLDVLPGLNCAAHFIIVADKPMETIDDHIAGGRQMQRLWLAAASVGLQFQPEMTPLIFSSYIRKNVKFSAKQKSLNAAKALAVDLGNLIGERELECAVYMGRVGYGPTPLSRSVRMPLEKLMFKN